ncbi:Diacylglycerol kinase (CTP) [Spironucleus salmonicida]|uniref:Diacylglycerol kinase (CTP) n=1 Tax=Spironucleus salmonicida TaxID=348837 RepID=V6LH95_9EUKA|nr:Diacylglycerol kinase (CTP) [Spironucleus salmonicida]|eukprot:EST43091.1 Phosphatidate cytidylyltransferase domain-containing protein [Spironucleus salmonicida]
MNYPLYVIFILAFVQSFAIQFCPSINKFLLKVIKQVLPSQKAQQFYSEFQRKSFHLLGLAFVIVIGEYPSQHIQIAYYLCGGSIVILLLDILRVHFNIRINSPFFRSYEIDHVTGVAPLLLGISVAIYLNSSTALICLFVGDSAAAIFGILFGKHKIYQKKSIEGCIGFIGAVFIVIYQQSGATNAIISGTVGCILELFGGKFDNFLIPVGVSLFMKSIGLE